MSATHWRTFEAILMTSEAIEAYGGVAFPEQTLRDVAEQFRNKPIPMHLDHNLTRPVRVRSTEVYVEVRDDGVALLKMKAEIHEDDLPHLLSRRGMSVSMGVPLPRDADQPRNEEAALSLSADHAWFSDELLLDAEAALLRNGVSRGDLNVERALQFSFVPDPQIFVTVVLPFLVSVGANVLWDAVKFIFSRRRTPPGGSPLTPTVVNVSVVDGERQVVASVSTTDEAVARRAIESLDHAAQTLLETGQDSPQASTRKAVIWHDESRRWVPPT